MDILTKTFIGIRQRLHIMASRMLADDAEADDVLQDAFYRLWQRRNAIESESQAEGLSTITVRNICIDNLRRRQNKGTEPLDTAITQQADEDDDDRRETYESVHTIIERELGERERRVITMRDSMGMDFEDIADTLGISENNVRMILSRARRTVRMIYLSRQKNHSI